MGVMLGNEDQPEISGLDPRAAERIVVELGRADGARVLRCLHTAEVMLRSAGADDRSLRWAESAAYNLREALDSVVRSHSAGEGGLAAALAAWARYKVAVALPDADVNAALADLAGALDELERDEDRQAFMARRLLAWIRQQTGVEPLPGSKDPTREYGSPLHSGRPLRLLPSPLRSRHDGRHVSGGVDAA